jgi:DNA-binding FadR family transcriptional regulator
VNGVCAMPIESASVHVANSIRACLLAARLSVSAIFAKSATATSTASEIAALRESAIESAIAIAKSAAFG